MKLVLDLLQQNHTINAGRQLMHTVQDHRVVNKIYKLLSPISSPYYSLSLEPLLIFVDFHTIFYFRHMV